MVCHRTLAEYEFKFYFILENIDIQPATLEVEPPVKPRYATRYSTRLAATQPEEKSTCHRRTTRFGPH